MKRIYFLLTTALCLAGMVVSAQNTIYKDKSGRLRWTENGTEAFFWGVNYTTPFAHAYRQIARNGFNHKEVIDADAYHLSRLGVNAYRIHVWDCEISDGEGNLIDNEHLNLLDYVIDRFQQRGIYVILTPIAYWGNGYPEPNENDLPGFSGKYNKGNVYTEPAAIAAQERYLKQFLNHVNPYSGKRYKDDPMIIAFEVCNEPGHSKAKETTEFVRKMAAAIRSTGCRKPVFYNVTQSIGLLKDFIKGGTDGVTFQWYPTGLVAGFERPGTFLPHVDRYDMPFRNETYFANQALMVYEFDAADVGRSYLYPPIALSFKEAGMQWVTQFAYDPMAIASSNTEYQTHFLNLAYAPQKAIGFKIAGELFRNPQYKRDRANEPKPFALPSLNISYEDDLSELVAGTLFYYTNNTSTRPENPSALQSIAGYGTSPVVTYNGRGAYFLDKISPGVWRLEVMPDAIWVRDPFSRATPRIDNVAIRYREHPMSIHLPELGETFHVTGVNKGNACKTGATGGQFTISPGAWILSVQPFDGDPQQIGSAGEYYAPKASHEEKLYLLHQPPETMIEGQTIPIEAEVVSNKPVKQLTLQLQGGMSPGRWRPISIPLEKTDAYRYTARIPDTLVRAGRLNYVLRVEWLSNDETIYPGSIAGPITGWEYYNPDVYSVKILPRKSPVALLTAEDTRQTITYSAGFGFSLQPVYSGLPGETVLKSSQITFPNAPAPRRDDGSDALYALENFIGRQIVALSPYTADYSRIVLHAKAEEEPVQVEIALISKQGGIYSAKAVLSRTQESQSIPLKDLMPGRMMLLPRPYPGFLPLRYSPSGQADFDLGQIERLQFILPKEGNNDSPAFELKSISLE